MSKDQEFEMDLSKVDMSEGRGERELLPDGDYLCEVTDGELRPTKAGTGKYVWLELTVIDGPHKGRKLWDRINVQNLNPKAEAIGRRQYAQLCLSAGFKADDKVALAHIGGRLCTARVKSVGPQGDWPAKNEVKGYLVKGARKDVSPSSIQPTSDDNIPW
jgi:hypothetical protein